MGADLMPFRFSLPRSAFEPTPESKTSGAWMKVATNRPEGCGRGGCRTGRCDRAVPRRGPLPARTGPEPLLHALNPAGRRLATAQRFPARAR
jgi:hypothetical protein